MSSEIRAVGPRYMRLSTIDIGRTPCAPTVLTIVLMFLSVCIFAEEVILTKAFTVKFRRVNEVATVINPLLSEKGAVTLQPRLSTVVVQDFEKNLRQVEMAITAFDTPPPNVEVSLKLVRATKNLEEVTVSDEIKNMAKLGEVLRFNQYSLLDSGFIECGEGQNSVLSLAKDYQVSFIAEVIQEGNGIIRFKNFQLKKRKRFSAGKEVFVPLISVTMNLRDAETLVLGASRFEESNQALFIILLAKVKK